MTSAVPGAPRVGPDGTLPTDVTVAPGAAPIQAHHDFKPPDALIIGTGLVAGVSWLVTGDEAWQRRLAQIESRIRVCYLGDYV